MPESCLDCNLEDSEGFCTVCGKGTPTIPIFSKEKPKRPGWCPLIESQERTTGYWIAMPYRRNFYEHICSNCLKTHLITTKRFGRYKYCPNCGAEMKIEEETK